MPAAHRTGLDQRGHIDAAAVGEQFPELGQVDDLVLRAEGVREPLQLRDPHVQRHLATLETPGHVLARLGALRATTGRLALGTLTTTDPCLRRLGAGSRAQVVDLEPTPRGVLGRTGLVRLAHSVTSSTSTRWLTVLTMPRTSGRSGRTTVAPIRRRPSVRRVSRWDTVPPIPDRRWVIFRSAIRTPHRSARRAGHLLRRVRAAWPPERRPRAGGHGEPRSPRAASAHAGR